MWQVAWAQVGTKELRYYLEHEWEPFGISPGEGREFNDPNFMVIWLKKYEPN